MCGILGYFNIGQEAVNRPKDEVIQLRDMMRNRGPDSSGYLEGEGRRWILAHRRLAILDLSPNGHQPMSDPSGKIHLCYNGEIYNYRKLRSDLVKLGVSFKSTSDTEVILYLYKRYGVDCFRMLEGMFALILVDDERQHAVIARDPVGKKPLYYALIGRNLIVASDPGVISRDREYKKAMSADGLYSILTMGGVRSPGSLFKDIYKLEPACYRIVDASFDPEAPSTRFFDFKFEKQNHLNDREDTIDTLDNLLEKAVEKRMISDVPFGIFLSGGIDSALILHYMSKHTDRVNTFSVDLQTSEESKKETHIASQLAERYKTNHRSVQLETAEYIEILDQVVLPNSTLGMTESILLAKLSQMARDAGVIVIETGEGADELMMGYNNYLSMLNENEAKLHRLRRMGAIVPVLAKVARMFGSDTRMDRLSYVADNFDAVANDVILRDFLYEPFLSYQAERLVRKYTHSRIENNKFSLLNACITSRIDDPDEYSPAALSVLWNTSFRLADLLVNRVDNFTMTSSVEGRAPMLDIDVINFGLSLVDSLKVRNSSSKYILRQIVKRHISPAHAELPKRGFGGGGRNLLNQSVCEYLRSKLLASYSYRHHPLIDVGKLGSRYQLFTLTSFHTWVDNWL